MDETLKEFGLLYPEYQTRPFTKVCCIQEPNRKSGTDFLKLNITGCDGQQFPYNFANDSTSFFKLAKSRDPMLFNCDGITCVLSEEKPLILLCELKSGFSTEQILHAKEQVVGSYIRLKCYMNVLQNALNCEVHGVIASYVPTTEALTRIKSMSGYEAAFSNILYSKKHKDLDPKSCNKAYYPINVDGFRIHYVGVPIGQQEYTISISDLLKL